MYLRLTLYKSGFDPGNPFVGISKADRESALASLPQIQVTGSYNPRRAFRISGNFLQYDRIYDYLKYELSESDDFTNAWIRFYYVSSYDYVNDNETNINVIPDMCGTLWWDLKFSQINPQRYTYGESEDYVKTFATEFSSTLYQFTEVANFKLTAGSGMNVGFIVNINSRSGAGYNENGVMQYPIAVDLVPFVYNNNSQLLSVPVRFQPTSAASPQIVINAPQLESYFLNKSDGNLIDNFVWLDAGAYFTATESGNAIIIQPKKPDTFITDNLPGSTPSDVICLTNNTYVTGSYTIPSENNALNRAPFINYRIELHNSFIDIDPLLFMPGDTLYFLQSFVPPFNCAVYTQNAFLYRDKPLYYIQPQASFFNYNDAYTEFLRTNYNSTVMGLKTQQDFADKNMALNIAHSGAKSIMNVANSQDVAGGLKELGGFAIDTIANFAANELKKQQQNALLDLKMADLKNTPDSVSINGSLLQIIRNNSWLRVLKGTSPAYNFYKRYYARFGFALQNRVPLINLRTHVIFDYLQLTDCTFATDSIKLTQNEYSQLMQELSSGVRLWYSLGNYKNFTIANPEV